MLPDWTLLGYAKRGRGDCSGSVQGGSQSWVMVLRTPEVFCPAGLPWWVALAWAMDQS